jgi:hypothetical protein
VDISSLGGLTNGLAQVQIGDAVSTLVLKKAIDIQEQSAMQLLQTLPQIASNPPNLGNSVDIKV